VLAIAACFPFFVTRLATFLSLERLSLSVSVVKA
jgi:hypothetical protein